MTDEATAVKDVLRVAARVLRRLRRERKLTMKQVAEATGLQGIAITTVRNLEIGEHIMRLDSLVLILNVYDLTPSAFFVMVENEELSHRGTEDTERN